jgi:galacturan 1,4-alpha-galacturonidase
MKLALTLWTLLVAIVVAAPAPAAQSDNGTLGTPNGTGSTSNRPIVIPGPYPPSVPFPNPPGRTRVCTVKTNGGGVDDSQNILDAFNKCNNGGHVIFPTNTTYTIGKTMDWSFLRSIDIGDWKGNKRWTGLTRCRNPGNAQVDRQHRLLDSQQLQLRRSAESVHLFQTRRGRCLHLRR